MLVPQAYYYRHERYEALGPRIVAGDVSVGCHRDGSGSSSAAFSEQSFAGADDIFSGDIRFAEPCSVQGVIGCWI